MSFTPEETQQRLRGRVFLLTGAASGIGAAIGQRLTAEGGRVLLVDLRAEALDAVADPLSPAGIAHPADVTDPDAMAAAVETACARFGRLDGVVHAAAAPSADGSVVDLPLAQWRRELDVSLTGAFLACQHAIPAMRRVGGGAIVFVSSIFGSVATDRAVAYCAAKAGLSNLARAIAIDHGAEGIRANCVSPGPVASDGVLQRWSSLAAAEAGLGERTLLGRIAQTGEIATAVAFLLSDEAGFMTGTDLHVDGGYAAR
jgi:NAD(P)-dependent dehydrogenase (short-subunit alcohol dehydrogenase family)